LIAIIPNIEEEKQLKEFTGSPDDLARPEKYLIKVIKN
jgi:hypothetical protein